MSQQSIFHQGELTVQALANEADIAQRNGVVISKHIIKGALPFIAQQFMAVISSIDENNHIWTSVLFGEPGFIQAPDDQHIVLNSQQIIQQPTDPLWQNIKHNTQVGVLIIELNTRRRLRVNGNITQVDKELFEITVAQAYPNCPKYIQRRQPTLSKDLLAQNTSSSKLGQELTTEQIELISQSDSFFVGSGVTNHHNDASYRGGQPGFIKINGHNQLVIPDYQGNSMFNTLGNIELHPYAGLTFIDFTHNKLLQLTGTAKILWHQDDEHNHTGGTKRYWQFNITNWQETQLAVNLNWTFFDYSPHNPKSQKNTDLSYTGLSLVVNDIQQKSDKVKVFRLSAKDNRALPAFEAGSHLPININLSEKNTVLRHYSIISSNQNKDFYDIAVQQEEQGRGGSNYLHKQLKIGDVLHTKQPVNAFSLSSTGKHHILIAGGIGITPILSMLRQLSENNESVELHYSVKTKEDLIFKAEILHLAGINAHFYYSQEQKPNKINLKTLLSAQHNSSHVYVCGPVSLITAIKDQARQNDWPTHHIHYESFGGSQQASNHAIEVTLKKSGQVITVDPKETILDSLIAADVQIPYECKRGECGMCSTEYSEGTVDHQDVYLTKAEKQHNLCVCVSRAKSKSITLNL